MPNVSKQFIIYCSDDYYTAHSSVCRTGGGDILVAFRRQPNRKKEGRWNMHIDADSAVCVIRSCDGGKTWSEAVCIHHESGIGDNDPVLTRLSDGRILLTFFNWGLADVPTREDAGGPNFTRDYHRRQSNNPWPGIFRMFGASIMHSDDDGKTWSPPRKITLPERFHGGRCAIQGHVAELPNGDILLPAYATTGPKDMMNSVVLCSHDRGISFEFRSIAGDGNANAPHGLDEHTLLHLANGDTVSFIRPAGDPSQNLWMSRSRDQGKNWTLTKVDGVKGVPQKAMHLRDGRVLLVYGYRFAPVWGVRARILDPECSNVATAEEITICRHGTGADVGYPDAVEVEPGRVLIVYYMSDPVSDGHIEASWMEIS